MEIKPSLEHYLICTGRSLADYNYDPILILENVNYFIYSYNKNISVKEALNKFNMGNLRSKYSDEEWDALVEESKISRKEIKPEEIWNDEKMERIKEAIREYQQNGKTLTIPDIRNKLSPITNMIALFERGEYNYIKNKGLDEVKKSINYLCDREVYKL